MISHFFDGLLVFLEIMTPFSFFFSFLSIMVGWGWRSHREHYQPFKGQSLSLMVKNLWDQFNPAPPFSYFRGVAGGRKGSFCYHSSMEYPSYIFIDCIWTSESYPLCQRVASKIGDVMMCDLVCAPVSIYCLVSSAYNKSEITYIKFVATNNCFVGLSPSYFVVFFFLDTS